MKFSTALYYFKESSWGKRKKFKAVKKISRPL